MIISHAGRAVKEKDGIALGYLQKTAANPFKDCGYSNYIGGIVRLGYPSLLDYPSAFILCQSNGVLAVCGVQSAEGIRA